MLDRWFDHAALRAMERYGIRFSHEIQNQMKDDVKQNVFNVLLRIPNSDRIVIRGRVLDTVVTAIYSTNHKVVVTFLHNSWVLTDTSEFYLMSKNRRKSNNKKEETKVPKGGNMVKIGHNHMRKLKAPRDKALVESQSLDGWEDT